MATTHSPLSATDGAGGLFLLLPGSVPLSPLHLESLRAAGLPLTTAHHLHFVALREPLSPTEMGRLEALLAEGAAATPEEGQPAFAHELLVIPRIGSISPWSTKATEIAHRCGLQRVERLERGICYGLTHPLDPLARQRLLPLLHDRMTQQVVESAQEAQALFHTATPRPLLTIPLQQAGRAALVAANQQMGLALSEGELDYLLDHFSRLGREPTDVELMMFAQANSEHCRHKIFNARWTIDGTLQAETLFGMIRHTEKISPQGTILAYRDNAAIMEGGDGDSFYPDSVQRFYGVHPGRTHLLMKVETHNHPTAISPYPGAATGSGGGDPGRGGDRTGVVAQGGVDRLYGGQPAHSWGR
ncbi:MAG: hypothetical protein H7835_15220, partial [Magnetococcus sp. XQGC-1]